MRVIAGTAKGRLITAPKGMNTRGSMGIEAISRGAQKAVFVENNHKAVTVIKKNLSACNLSEKAVAAAKILSSDGIIAIRTRKENDMPDFIKNLVKIKIKIYGISAIHFYQQQFETV